MLQNKSHFGSLNIGDKDLTFVVLEPGLCNKHSPRNQPPVLINGHKTMKINSDLICLLICVMSSVVSG